MCNDQDGGCRFCMEAILMKPEQIELRGMCPRDVVDVLDAVSTARRMSRHELVVEVLAVWAKEQVHIANVLGRVTRGNGSATEAAGR